LPREGEGDHDKLNHSEKQEGKKEKNISFNLIHRERGEEGWRPEKKSFPPQANKVFLYREEGSYEIKGKKQRGGGDALCEKRRRK